MFRKISEGVHGEIFSNGKIIRKVKFTNNLGTEFAIQRAAYEVSPKFVVKPKTIYRNNKTFNMNYIPDIVPIDVYRGPRPFEKIVEDVIITISKIQKKYPTFRHHDLHLDNVVVTPEGIPKILDFGLANIDKDGFRNPLLYANPGYMEVYGTFPESDKAFDYHFFLNQLYMSGNPELRSIADKLLPKKYKGKRTSRVKNYRLRYNIDHSKFPSAKKLISLLNDK